MTEIDLTPITRLEYDIDAILNDHAVAEPITRIELILADIVAGNTTTVEPVTRIETYLAIISGADYPVPEPVTRIETFLAIIAGEDYEEPEAVTRLEGLLAEWVEKGSGIWKTVTGTLIHITDALASPVKELSVAIEPQQSGTGDPSPTNIRPITGATGARIVNAQELNLMFPTSTDSVSGYGITIDYLGNGKYHIHGTSTSGSYLSTIRTNSFVIPSGDGRRCDFNNSASGFSIRFMNGSSVVDTWNITRVNNYTTGYSAMAGKTTDGFAIAVGSGKTVDFTLQVIFSKNIFTDIPISWQTEAGTVYGGTLDVVSGELTVDRVSLTFDGSSDEVWKIVSASRKFAQCEIERPIKYTNGNAVPPMISNMGIAVERNATYSAITYSAVSASEVDTSTVRYLYAGVTDTLSLSNFKAWLGEHNLQIVYELATPLTYQLTPQQVETLAGENNIWADVNGEITLTYKSDGRDSDKADIGKADFMKLLS